MNLGTGCTMSDRNLSQEPDDDALSLLRHAVAAHALPRRLLENLLAMAGSSVEGDMLKATLQKTLEIATDLIGAETGSLFLLNSEGRVTDSLLTRNKATPQERSNLIGTVLDKGLAGWAIRHRQMGLIADTEKDERWLTLPDQPYTVRSALALPIIRGKELLGILTLLHSQPNHFSQEAAELMQVSADQMALVLENVRLYAKLDEYSKALDRELEKGRMIQRGFLPNKLPQLPEWDIATCFYPAYQVAGDFYDAFELPGGYVGLAIADVCDKGVGAALFMALFRSLIRVFSGQTQLCGFSIVGNEEGVGNAINMQGATDLNQINALKAVALTNNYIAHNHWQMDMFATLFFGVLNPATGLLSYINGGHEPLFLVGKSGIKETLKSTGPAVGAMPDMTFKVQQVQFEPGDILIGYTDGVTEGKAPNGELFTRQRLLSLLQQPAVSGSELLDRIKTHLFSHIHDAPQGDDITMLAVQRHP